VTVLYPKYTISVYKQNTCNCICYFRMFKVTMQQIKYLMFIDLPWKKELIFYIENRQVYVNIVSFGNKNIVFRNQGGKE